MKRWHVEILLDDDLADKISKWENETGEDAESLIEILLIEKFKEGDE
jgi:hypothetical protein